MASEELTLCELCEEQRPWVARLVFRRGKVRMVCIGCMAELIQGVTGFKMVNMLDRMVQQRVAAPALRAAALEINRQLREEAYGRE